MLAYDELVAASMKNTVCPGHGDGQLRLSVDYRWLPGFHHCDRRRLVTTVAMPVRLGVVPRAAGLIFMPTLALAW